MFEKSLRPVVVPGFRVGRAHGSRAMLRSGSRYLPVVFGNVKFRSNSRNRALTNNLRCIHPAAPKVG